MQSALIILGILLATKFLTWLNEVTKNTREVAENHRKMNAEATAHANTLRLLNKELENPTEITDDNLRVVQNLAMETNLINKQFGSEKEKLDAIRKSTIELIATEEAFAAARKKLALKAEFKDMRREYQNFVDYGEAQLGILEIAWIKFKKTLAFPIKIPLLEFQALLWVLNKIQKIKPVPILESSRIKGAVKNVDDLQAKLGIVNDNLRALNLHLENTSSTLEKIGIEKKLKIGKK